MKTIRLKVIGLTALILITFFGIRIFWPGQTMPKAGSKDTKQQVIQENKSDLQKQLKTQQPESRQQVVKRNKRPSPQKALARKERRIEKLYQTALSHKATGKLTDMDYRIMAGCCSEILREYPNSLYAEKAKELLSEVPEKYIKEHAEEMSFMTHRTPKVKKSKYLPNKIQKKHRRPPDIVIEKNDI
jgi:hypothetical protein